MPIQTKANGAIKTVSNCKVKVGGAWKQVVEVLTKVNGEWKRTWANNAIAYNISLSTTSNYSKEFSYDGLTPKLNYKNIHIQAFDSSGNIVGEYKGSKLNDNDFTISIYNKNNVSVGYVTIYNYNAYGVIRYAITIEERSLVSKMTLNIEVIEAIN